MKTITRKGLATLLAALLVTSSLSALGVDANENGLLFAGAAAEEAVVDERQAQYDAAQALYEAGDYEKAAEAFDALGAYLDSARKWKEAQYRYAVSLYDAGEYEQAIAAFEPLGAYKESKSYRYESTMAFYRAQYQRAKELMEAEDYAAALAIFESLGTFNGSKDRAAEAAELLAAQQLAQAELGSYEKGVALKEQGDLQGAIDAFIEAGRHEGATEAFYETLSELRQQQAYAEAEAYAQDGAFERAAELFTALEDYADSRARAEQATAEWHKALYDEAKALADKDSARAAVLLAFANDVDGSDELAKTLDGKVSAEALSAAADKLMQEGEYALAQVGFAKAAPHADSAEKAAELETRLQNQRDYRRADLLNRMGKDEEANALFAALGDYEDAALRIVPEMKRITTKQFKNDRTTEKSEVFTAPDGSKHCYQIFKGVHRWVDAKRFCELLGGHLATLTTPEENEYVYRFMRSNGFLTAYFGLSDEERVGDWTWVTGEPFEYRNWHRGEPSRSGRERYGMYFYKHKDGSWNDSHFYETAEVDPGCSFICEWDLP